MEYSPSLFLLNGNSNEKIITGYFGMNVPYPGFSERVGFAGSIGAMVLAGIVLYFIFKRKDWL
ncbi:MAG: hypothetical protein LBI49_13070 [Nocardiopsaceae bacterium]|nr:hypothetical protein [Nocardiopsaceae bacterium]